MRRRVQRPARRAVADIRPQVTHGGPAAGRDAAQRPAPGKHGRQARHRRRSHGRHWRRTVVLTVQLKHYTSTEYRLLHSMLAVAAQEMQETKTVTEKWQDN